MQSRFGIGSSLRLGRIHVLLLVPFFLCRTSGKSRTKGKKRCKVESNGEKSCCVDLQQKRHAFNTSRCLTNAIMHITLSLPPFPIITRYPLLVCPLDYTVTTIDWCMYVHVLIIFHTTTTTTHTCIHIIMITRFREKTLLHHSSREQHTHLYSLGETFWHSFRSTSFLRTAHHLYNGYGCFNGGSRSHGRE